MHSDSQKIWRQLYTDALATRYFCVFDVNIIVMQFVDISWVAMKDKS